MAPSTLLQHPPEPPWAMPLCNDATNLIRYKIQKKEKLLFCFGFFAFLKKNCVLHLQWRSKITEGGCPNDVNEVTGQGREVGQGKGKGDTKKFCCKRGQNVAMSINVSRLVTHSLTPLLPHTRRHCVRRTTQSNSR